MSQWEAQGLTVGKPSDDGLTGENQRLWANGRVLILLNTGIMSTGVSLSKEQEKAEMSLGEG